MNLFKKFSSIAMVGVLTTSAFLFPVGDSNASANSSDRNGNGKEELQFELSPENRYIITFKDKGKGKSSLHAFGGQVKSEYSIVENTVVVEMNDKAIKALAKNPNVVDIDPDILLEQEATYTAPFHANDWVIKQTGAESAFANGVSGQGVKVAIVDSGIDTDNPMLTHAIKGGTSVVSWSSNYEDMTGHGTMVAGALAGKYQGKPYGVAPDVELYAVKATVSASSGSAYISDLERGIEWALNSDMDVVNVSFDPTGASDRFNELSAYASSQNMLIVHSAGNDTGNRDIGNSKCMYYSVYCISSVDQDNEISYFSAYGRQNVFAGTYGGNVPVVAMGRTTPTTASGTSFSAPIFAGLYALYFSQYESAYSYEPNYLDTLLKMRIASDSTIITEKPIGEIGLARYSHF